MKINISKNKEIIIKVTVLLFVILMCVLVFIKIKTDTNPNKIMETQKTALFEGIDKNNTVNVTKYTVYGTHFNIEGTLDIVKLSGINIEHIDLVVKNLSDKEFRNKSQF